MTSSVSDKQQMLGNEEGEEFIVERIVNHRIRNGRKEYLLQWKGYSEEENTWEPDQNLDCPDLIEEYENRLLQKTRYINNDPSGLKRKSSLDQAPVHNKRGRPPLDRSNYAKQQQQHQPQPQQQQQQQHQQQTASTRNDEPSAFDRGYEAEKILGATDSTGELMLLVQWKGVGEADLVPSRICNIKCPQVVIKFYEERLTWIATQQQQQQQQQATNDTNNNNTDNNLLTSQSTMIENKNSNSSTL